MSPKNALDIPRVVWPLQNQHAQLYFRPDRDPAPIRDSYVVICHSSSVDFAGVPDLPPIFRPGGWLGIRVYDDEPECLRESPFIGLCKMTIHSLQLGEHLREGPQDLFSPWALKA